jgi:hypothetical protein
MKHKVVELEGALLDAAVALAIGIKFDLGEGICWLCTRRPDGNLQRRGNFHPSTSWTIAGPILDEQRIAVFPFGASPRALWCAHTESPRRDARGRTPLIAAMRALVASKLGDEVDLP